MSTPQEHWRSLVLSNRFSQGNPADPPAEFLAGVEFGKSHRAEALPQTDLVAFAETALMLARQVPDGPWVFKDFGKVALFSAKTREPVLLSDGQLLVPKPGFKGTEEIHPDGPLAQFIANARTSNPILAQAVLDLAEKLEEARKAMLAALQHLGCDPCELTEALSRITPSQPKEGE